LDIKEKPMFFCALSGGFYDPAINGESGVPAGAVAITSDEHAALLKGNSEGRRLGSDEHGRPILLDPLPISDEDLAISARAWRDSELARSDRVIARHRDESEAGVDSTLTVEQYSELQGYRFSLRNWPESYGFPMVEHRPSIPDWFANLFH
jgi:hypothetical protein